MHRVAAVRLPRGTCIGRHAAACRAPRHGLFWRTMMNKRAVSAHDVGLHGAPSTGLSRVSSQYDSIPMDVQNRLQSMGWRIRSNVSRGYRHGGSSSGASALDTVQQVRQTSHQWGRTASVPHGALRGMAPPMPTGAADEAPSPFSLKRGTAEDDSDAVLADAFGDDDGCEMDALPVSEPMSCDADVAHARSERPMRPLPARQGLRVTQSMPPSAPAWRDLAAESHRDADAFRLIDFSAFATHADHF